MNCMVRPERPEPGPATLFMMWRLHLREEDERDRPLPRTPDRHLEGLRLVVAVLNDMPTSTPSKRRKASP
jgi:hypothetical protein